MYLSGRQFQKSRFPAASAVNFHRFAPARTGVVAVAQFNSAVAVRVRKVVVPIVVTPLPREQYPSGTKLDEIRIHEHLYILPHRGFGGVRVPQESGVGPGLAAVETAAAVDVPAEMVILEGQQDAAVLQMLGKSRSTLWRWDKSGYLPCYKKGGRNEYRLSDVERVQKCLGSQ